MITEFCTFWYFLCAKSWVITHGFRSFCQWALNPYFIRRYGSVLGTRAACDTCLFFWPPIDRFIWGFRWLLNFTHFCILCVKIMNHYPWFPEFLSVSSKSILSYGVWIGFLALGLRVAWCVCFCPPIDRFIWGFKWLLNFAHFGIFLRAKIVTDFRARSQNSENQA